MKTYDNFFILIGSSTTGKPIGAYCDILARCEVSRVLLLMLLQVAHHINLGCCIFKLLTELINEG